MYSLMCVLSSRFGEVKILQLFAMKVVSVISGNKIDLWFFYKKYILIYLIYLFIL